MREDTFKLGLRTLSAQLPYGKTPKEDELSFLWSVMPKSVTGQITDEMWLYAVQQRLMDPAPDDKLPIFQQVLRYLYRLRDGMPEFAWGLREDLSERMASPHCFHPLTPASAEQKPPELLPIRQRQPETRNPGAAPGSHPGPCGCHWGRPKQATRQPPDRAGRMTLDWQVHPTRAGYGGNTKKRLARCGLPVAALSSPLSLSPRIRCSDYWSEGTPQLGLMSESQSEAPWDRWPRESVDAHRRFLHFRDGDRQLKSTANAFGLACSTVHEQSRRFRWLERCRAWDAARVCASEPRDMEQSSPSICSGLGATPEAGGYLGSAHEHVTALEDFRQECEAAGRSTLKLARATAACATRSAARLLREEVALTPREIVALAGVSAQLAVAGQAQWGRAIGVDRMLLQLESVVLAVDS